MDTVQNTSSSYLEGGASRIFSIGDDELFRACWKLNDCWTCLKSKDPCGWCPFSQTCVPNKPPSPLLMPLLTPIFNENICPHWAERWELRAKPMMCNVSTITFLSSLISILSTIAVLASVFGFIILIRWLNRRRRLKILRAEIASDIVQQEAGSSSVPNERTSLLSRLRTQAEPPPSPGKLQVKRRQSFWAYNTMPTTPVQAQSRAPPTPRRAGSSGDGTNEANARAAPNNDDGQDAALPGIHSRHEWEERRRALLGKRAGDGH